MLSTLSSASTLLGLAKDGHSGLQYLRKRLDGREPIDVYLEALKESVANQSHGHLQRHQTALDLNLDLCRDRLKGAAIDPTEMPVFAADLDQGFAQRVAQILSQEDILIGFDAHLQADEGLPLSVVQEAHQRYERLLWAAFPESTLKQALEDLSRANRQQQSTLNEIAAALNPAHEAAKRLTLLGARAVVQIQRRTLTLLGRPEYQLPSDLISRPELVDLHAKLTSDTAPRRWILTSDAGVGKSTLLNELTHRLHGEGYLVLLIDARQLRSFTTEKDFSNWLEAEQSFRDALDAAVQRSSGRLIVLIDQYDGLLEERESRNVLADVVRSAPTTVRWVLACRVNSPVTGHLKLSQLSTRM